MKFLLSLWLVLCAGGALAIEADHFSDFGASTPGGSGGKIIRVTTLDADGPGSLAAAVAESGPRIVVFEVAGVIDLDRRDLKIREPFITIAGQTAPSPGITLIRGGLKVLTHDVKLQHLRWRIGDAGMAKKSNFEKDASIEGAQARRVLVDHCSFSWATDENLSVSGPRLAGPLATAGLVTLSNNIIAEALHDSAHIKGPHSMGSLIHDNVREVAVIGNLYAHNNDRNPFFKANTTGLIANNYIYNPGSAAIRLDYVPAEWEGHDAPALARVTIVNNVMQAGKNTSKGLALVRGSMTGGTAWMDGNLAFGVNGEPGPLIQGKFIALAVPPVWPAGPWQPMPASVVREHVLAHAGARPQDRDAVDARIIAEVRAGRGQRIDSQDQVGGYPQAEPVYRKLDIPVQDVEGWLARLARDLE
jgi:hypothetical protein